MPPSALMAASRAKLVGLPTVVSRRAECSGYMEGLRPLLPSLVAVAGEHQEAVVVEGVRSLVGRGAVDRPAAAVEAEQRERREDVLGHGRGGRRAPPLMS